MSVLLQGTPQISRHTKPIFYLVYKIWSEIALKPPYFPVSDEFLLARTTFDYPWKNTRIRTKTNKLFIFRPLKASGIQIPFVPFKSQSGNLPPAAVWCGLWGSLSGIANESITMYVRITHHPTSGCLVRSARFSHW